MRLIPFAKFCFPLRGACPKHSGAKATLNRHATPLVSLRLLGSKKIFFSLGFLFMSTLMFGATYTSIQNGNWQSSSPWIGGSVPSSDIGSGDIVNIHHHVIYNNGSDLKNNGKVYITPKTSGSNQTTTARMEVPGGRSVFNYEGAEWYIVDAEFIQYRFSGGGNSGTNQSGKWLNEKGFVYIKNAYMEIAQDWDNTEGTSCGSVRINSTEITSVTLKLEFYEDYATKSTNDLIEFI